MVCRCHPGCDAALPSSRTAQGKESEFFIDDQAIAEDREHFRRPDVPTTNPVCAVVCSDTTLYVAREYALPRQLECKYDVRCRPQRLFLNSNSSRLALIDVRGVLSLWDVDAPNPRPLRVSSPTSPSPPSVQNPIGVRLDFERKECWDLRWSDDYPDIFAVMEKARMYIFRGTQPEEPLPSTAYICSFQDLEVRAVLLDEIMLEPDYPDKQRLLNFETKSLRDTKQLVRTVDIQEVYSFIDSNPHPRLWNMLAEVALERLDFPLADKAFVLCRDYHGVQFVKRLRLLNDPAKQKAEVMVYFKKFDVAERMYREMDRADLAIALRIKLGDWARVAALVQEGAGDDELLMRAYNEIGEYYADRQKWSPASSHSLPRSALIKPTTPPRPPLPLPPDVTALRRSRAMRYFAQAKNTARLAQCHYVMEDYPALEKLMQYVHPPPHANPHPNLISRPVHSPFDPPPQDIGQMFASVGLTEQAVAAFLKGRAPGGHRRVRPPEPVGPGRGPGRGAPRPQIDELLTKYANPRDPIQAIDLYRKAHRHIDAARLLDELGLEAGRKGPTRAVGARMGPATQRRHWTGAGGLGFPVLVAALPYPIIPAISPWPGSTRHPAHLPLARHPPPPPLPIPRGRQARAALEQMLSDDITTTGADKKLDTVWRGAEAYHFLILAQRQLYGGDLEAALRTSIRLQEYEDLIDPRTAYSLMALTAFHGKQFAQCSRAFTKLEGLEGTPTARREAYEELALAIFTRHAPADAATARTFPCPKCQTLIPDWATSCGSCRTAFPACVASGRSLIERDRGRGIYMCPTCKHRAYEVEITGNCCPLCHSPIV
ncbi:putative WD40 repeat protein [Paratrimastix pyriformis]|uniref:WD40 repeat protein n=1 Tax=Paratrimastix pyriformis TaxID=342808 RepID=A0ABQ8UMS2_9EUKA|nr:putative WD40 repeat protein [Paratrimastix pyriformis]